MAKYRICTKFSSNIPYQYIYYDLSIHKTKGDGEKFFLLQVEKQPVLPGYITGVHETKEIDDDLSIIYIMDIMLYRKSGEEYIRVFHEPVSRMYRLKDMISGKPVSSDKKESVCYFETSQQVQKSEQGNINNYHVKISCEERMFIAPEHPIGDPLDPFSKEKIDRELQIRTSSSTLSSPSLGVNVYPYPFQQETMLCGPAAFFYCLLIDRPDLYEAIVRGLWRNGKIKVGDLNIEPSFKTRRPGNLFYSHGKQKISSIDWISLASLRDSENRLMTYDSPDDKVSAITMWGRIEDWFTKMGSRKLFSNISLTHSKLRDVVMLNNYVGQGRHITSLISAGMLQLGADSPFKDHWIVWEGPVRLAKDNTPVTLESDLNEIVKLNLFSWGEVKDWLEMNLTLSDFLKNTFGAMVFEKIP
ncbi:hypothetical protein [Brenneria goodwinii]|uniref:hypothetical protein n=1 Tax=Brenneria goodwinii TaxID=1109412 RepID=UPI000BAFBA31|nr:hypothetical protein [Brenneria goodwinii]ATA23343.1 hypothetical protein AWC36_04045 [Brenneria goodwinii]